MCKRVFSCYHAIFLYIVFFFSPVHCNDGIQGIELYYKHISQNIEASIKQRTDKDQQQFEKDKICTQANISFDFVPEENGIVFYFQLNNKMCQDHFNYIYISINKKDEVIKEAKIPYLNDRKRISYRFENVSCGIYKGVVQVCFDKKYCLLDTWFKEPINVTSLACMGILQSKITPGESGMLIYVVFAVVSAIMPIPLGCLFYIYKRDSRKHEYMNVGYSVVSYKDIKVGINEDFRKEIKSIHIYIFHKYDKEKITKKKVKFLIGCLGRVDYILNNAVLRNVDSPVNVRFKTIESELLTTTCLDNVDDWLNNVMKDRKTDGILQKCILIESSIEEKEDDVVENEIFSYVENKLRNNKEVYLKTFKLPELSDQPDPESTTYNLQLIPASDSHPYLHVEDFCYDICSEFVVPSTKESARVLFYQYLDKQSNELKNSSESK